MRTLRYFKPKSIEEACSLLHKYGEDSKVIAGGTDLLRQIKNKVTLPNFLISIADIGALDYISYDETNGIRIGALTTVDSIKNSSFVRSKYNALAHASDTLGSPTIRRQATVGGNLCNGSPAADIATALMVLGTQVKTTSVQGENTIPIDKFFIGPGKTIINHSQILTEIQIPTPPLNSGSAFEKQTRRQGADLAVASVAALAVMHGDIFSDIKISLGAVALTPIRAAGAEEGLRGKKLDDRLLEESSQTASRESTPMDDIRGFADHRRKLVAALLKRVIRPAVAQAQTEVKPCR